MIIEVGAPACLPLGLIWLEQDGQQLPGLLGVTLQHPPVHLLARTSNRDKLHVTGARADAAYRAAAHFLQRYALPGNVTLEIELAIPMFMGLSSDSMLALSVARALALVYNRRLEDPAALAQAAGTGAQSLVIDSFGRGGVLGVPLLPALKVLPPINHRYEVAHPEKQAWAFVLILPRVSDDTPATLEQDRRAALARAAPYLDQAVDAIVQDQLWLALARSNLAAFGAALMQIQHYNQVAGAVLPFTPQEQAILDILRDHGALAWGRSATGMALYGLVEGAEASRTVRTALRNLIGPYGGRVMATIVDNTGARHTVRDTNA